MNKEIIMKKGSTLFLKGAVFFIAAALLAFCIFAIPAISKGMGVEFPSLARFQYPMLVGMYLIAIPFFFALYQALKLLNYIDKNIAFSELSVKALKNIKYCGIIMTILHVGILPLFYAFAQADDAPGVVLIGMVITAAPLVVAVFAAVLQRLLRNAIDMKSENELTV